MLISSIQISKVCWIINCYFDLQNVPFTLLQIISIASNIYLYTNTLQDGSVTLSVILFVRYRSHFPVVRFQNQAHIWNPHGTGHVFKTIWGADGTPIFFFFHRRRRRHSPGGRGKSRRRREFREFIWESLRKYSRFVTVYGQKSWVLPQNF